MSKPRPLSKIVCLLLVSGCVPSLHPLYTEKDLVLEPALVGVWVGGERDSQTWRFEKSKGKSYTVTHSTKNEEPAKFEGHLVRLNNVLFMDLLPEKLDRGNDFYKLHFVRSHTFVRVSFENETLMLHGLSPEWLKKRIGEGKVSIRHEEAEGGLVLTASTEELQEFVRMYANDPDAFGKFGDYRRRR